MTRDREAEWRKLLAGERTAFRAMERANPIASGQRIMGDDVRKVYGDAFDEWKRRRRELEAFLGEWKADPSFYGVPVTD